MVSVLLFVLGVLGVVLNRGHLIIMLLAIELIFLGASFLFLINSIMGDTLVEQIFVIFLLTVAAAESSIGLAILVAYYRLKGTIAIHSLNWLRG